MTSKPDWPRPCTGGYVEGSGARNRVSDDVNRWNMNKSKHGDVPFELLDPTTTSIEYGCSVSRMVI